MKGAHRTSLERSVDRFASARWVRVAVFVVAALLAVGAVVSLVTEHWGWLLAIALVLFVAEVAGAGWHDHLHRRRSEPVHALWGSNNQNRPARLGGPDAPPGPE